MLLVRNGLDAVLVKKYEQAIPESPTEVLDVEAPFRAQGTCHLVKAEPVLRLVFQSNHVVFVGADRLAASRTRVHRGDLFGHGATSNTPLGCRAVGS